MEKNIQHPRRCHENFCRASRSKSCARIASRVRARPGAPSLSSTVSCFTQGDRPPFSRTWSVGHAHPPPSSSAASVDVSLRNLLSYPWIETKVRAGVLRLHGFYYTMEPCAMRCWELEVLRTNFHEIS